MVPIKYKNDCKFVNFLEGFIFAELRRVKIKPSRNGELALLFIDVGKLCQFCDFFNVTNMSFNAIHEN